MGGIMKSKARPTQQLDVNRIFFPSFFFLAVKRVHSRSCKLGYLKLLSRGYERYTNYPLRSFNIRDLSNLSFFFSISSLHFQEQLKASLSVQQSVKQLQIDLNVSLLCERLSFQIIINEIYRVYNPYDFSLNITEISHKLATQFRIIDYPLFSNH